MGGKTISTSETKIEALQLQSSAYGVTVPLAYGLSRFAGNLVWYGGFKATPHTESQGTGGKGGVKTQNTTFTYSASVMMGLCHGVINGIPRVWKGKEQFYGGITPSQLLTVSETTTSGGPGSTFTPAHAATWRANIGVTAPLGGADNFDATTPLAEGVHYSVAAGVYTWLVLAAGLTVTVTYQYTTGTVTQTALQQLGLTFIKGEIGQAVWSPLTTLAPSQAIGYSGMAIVAGQDYALGTGAQVDNHLFEVQGPMAYSVSSSTPDADPADIVADVLLNARYGASFPAVRLANTTLWSDYNRASGLLCSPALTEQARAADVVTMAARLTNTAPVWSAGRLKFVPYGDTLLTGNSRIYTPNVTPLYDLTDDHYLDRDMPVDVQAKAPSERYNHIRLEFRNRGAFDGTKLVYTGQYAVEVIEAKDQADIEANGLRSAPIEQMHWICDSTVASKVAFLLLYRSLFVTNTYRFRLPWTFALVEPMDLLTLTDAAQWAGALPVRVTAREEDEDGELTFTAEDFPLGIATATLYDSAVGAGFAHDYNASPGSALAPMIFEAPGALVTTTGLEVYVAATGTGANWGGCHVWVSLDGTTYRQVARLDGGSRFGTLTGAISGGNLPVLLNSGQLLAGSATDAAQLSTLCFIGGAAPEFLAYQGAALTGPLAYTLSGLVPAFGSPTSAHASLDPFVRIDDAIAKSGPLEVSYIGKTIHVKLTSFNTYGGAEESLASVTDYTYTLTGGNRQYVWTGKPADYANNGDRGGYCNSDPLLMSPAEWSFFAVSGANPTYYPGFNGGNGLVNAWDKLAGGSAWIFSAPFPVSAFKTYLIETSLYTWSSNANVYFFAVAFFDAAGVLLDGLTYPTGWPAVGTYHYYGLINATQPLTGAARYSLAFGARATPQIPANAVTARVLILGDYANVGFRWSWGGAQVREVSDTELIATDAATSVYQDTHDFAGVSLVAAGAGAVSVRSFSITPTVDSTVEVTGTIIADTVYPDSGNFLGWQVTPGAGAPFSIGGCETNVSIAKQLYAFSRSFSALGGVTQTFSLMATRATGNPAMHGFLTETRVTTVKR